MKAFLFYPSWKAEAKRVAKAREVRERLSAEADSHEGVGYDEVESVAVQGAGADQGVAAQVGAAGEVQASLFNLPKRAASEPFSGKERTV